MTKIIERNAIIGSADFLLERGLLTAHIQLFYSGAAQSFGGQILMVPAESPHRQDTERGPNYAGLFIDRVMQVVGVSRWSDLQDKAVRVRQDNGCVHALGHIVEDNWFTPKDEFERLARSQDDD